MNNLHIVAINNLDRVVIPEKGFEGSLAFIDRDYNIVARTQEHTWEFIGEFYESLVNELVSQIWTKLTNSRWYTTSGEYTIDEEVYQRWYKWYWFIDGEDAYEYLYNCPNGNTLHSAHFQAVCGATEGWSYFKKLKDAGFNARTAALLAYTRGYIEGMDLNAPWSREGEEALYLIGLKRID